MQPSLEYQHAFDLCAVEVRRRGVPIVIFASSPFYAREILKRLHREEVMWMPLFTAQSLREWLGPEVESSHFRVDFTSPGSLAPLLSKSLARCVVWAEPEAGHGKQGLEHIIQVLPSDGHLYAIVSNLLARFLPEWQRDSDRPSQQPVGLWQTIKWLREAGFTIEALYGFHGPQSILWGYASRPMEFLGRSDLADRCLLRMRATYVVQGWQAFLAPVGVIWAQWREGSS